MSNAFAKLNFQHFAYPGVHCKNTLTSGKIMLFYLVRVLRLFGKSDFFSWYMPCAYSPLPPIITCASIELDLHCLSIIRAKLVERK